MIAALYVDPRGLYPAMLGEAQCWDRARNAVQYADPWPIVAHPACGPWGRLAHLYGGSEAAGRVSREMIWCTP